MERNNRRGALAFLAPLAICLPCLLLPLVIIGGAAVFSAIGGIATGSLVLAAAVLLGGAALAGGVYLRRRRADRNPDACCPVPTTAPETADHAAPERPQAVGSAVD